jgi:tRNA(fMet)-specific endonuclease VapC
VSSNARKDALLDTGVANIVLRTQETVERLSGYGHIFVPDIVLGELYYGAYYYAARYQTTKYLDLCDDFLQQYRHQLMHANEDTLSIYGAIAAELRLKGQPMQQNDMWIAALARQYQLTILTTDKDYLRVPHLLVEIW